MSAIFSRGERFEALSSSALREREYETVIATEAEHLFPQFWFVRFKATVSSEEGSCKADYALIDKDYRRWWVVEIELAHHSLEGHVLPQVAILANATYGAPEADYLAAQEGRLDAALLHEMMLGRAPDVLVIVNEHVPAWNASLAIYGALVVVVRVYRSNQNRHLLYVEGQLPEVTANLVSRCRRSRLFPKWLEVESPASMGAVSGQGIQIFVEGRAATWTRVDQADMVWLMPTASDPLDPSATTFDLVRVDGERLEFRVVR